MRASLQSCVSHRYGQLGSSGLAWRVLVVAGLVLVAQGRLPAVSRDDIDISVVNFGGEKLVVTAPGGGTMDRRTELKLRAKITLQVEDAELADVARFLHEFTGANFVVDPKIQPELITLKVKEMTAARVVEWVAEQSGTQVSFINEAVYFSDEPARGATITKVYDVADLTSPMKDFPGPSLSVPEPGGTGSQLIPPIEHEQPRTDAQELADILEEMIDYR